MTLTEKELWDYKKQIEDSKNELAELKGRQKEILKQLKTKYQCDSIEEAEAKIQEYDSTIALLEKRIKKESIKIEEKLVVTTEQDDSEGS